MDKVLGIEKLECGTEAFWNRFEEARIKAGKTTLRALCRKTDVSYQTLINQKCSGRYLSIPDLISVSRELGCSIDWLLTGRTSAEQSKKLELIERIRNSDISEIEALAYLIGKM